VVAVFEVMDRSCPAPRPRVILAIIPWYAFCGICRVLFPAVFSEWIPTANSGCFSSLQ
jgi:hypothetical protein